MNVLCSSTFAGDFMWIEQSIACADLLLGELVWIVEYLFVYHSLVLAGLLLLFSNSIPRL